MSRQALISLSNKKNIKFICRILKDSKMQLLANGVDILVTNDDGDNYLLIGDASIETRKSNILCETARHCSMVLDARVGR